MQPARSMFLNDESRRAFNLFWNGLACRFARLFEVAFAFVFGQRHHSKLNQNCRDDTRASARNRRSRPTGQCRLSETAVETLRFARQRLADQVANETTNHNVLAQFSN